MKYVLALIAALALSAPAFAQETETLPDGRKVRIEVKDGTVIIKDGDEAEEETEESEEVEKDVEKIHEELRKQLEKGFDEGDICKQIEEILKRIGEKSEEAEEVELPEDVQEILKRAREQMEEMRKGMEERMKKMREELEKNTEELESDPDAEVEEYEHTSPDGKTHVKVKIVRIRKVVKSEGEAPETPKGEPKKETERKQ